MAFVERGSDSGNATPTATVRRLTAVLDAFLVADGDLGVTELAEQLRLAKSVSHRLVAALTDAGYLSRDAVTRRYRLGPKAVRLGLVALAQINISQHARQYLEALATETGETATLSILDGEHRVYVQQVESSQTIRQTVQLGQHAPLYVGASGKALLAYLPEERGRQIVRHAMRSAATQATGAPLDERRLLDELAEIRAQGFAISQSERILGAASAAAPVFDHHGEVVASLSVASVTVRHGRADLTRFGELVRGFAERLSADLGWTGARGASPAGGRR